MARKVPQVFLVSLEGPHLPQAKLRYGQKGGGLYTDRIAADEQRRHLESKGFNVKFYIGDVTWRTEDEDKAIEVMADFLESNGVDLDTIDLAPRSVP